jgi:DNA mismatch repair protein MutS2
MISSIVLEKLEFSKILGYISKYAVTVDGKSVLQNIIPLSNKDDVLLQGNYVSEAKEILIKNDIPPLSYIPKLTNELSKSCIEGTILNKKHILEILNLAETSRKVYQFLKPQTKSKFLFNEFSPKLFIDINFEQSIRNIFNENGDVRDNASAKLKEIKSSLREKSDQLRRVVNKILKQLSEAYLVQEEYITQRDGRIVIPVKSEHKRHVKGFIHSESATGQTVYIEPEETLELNNEILTLTFAEKREIDRILQLITKRIGDVSNELKNSLRAIADLDAIFAKANYSIEILGSFPTVYNQKTLRLIDARHPILITGPNAGGKTVVLKTMSLITIMALSGLHIPAHPDSNIHFLNNVLIDIGDEQSIEDDLSTFSSHLNNINQIIREVDSNSLVLLDEIGTGTDPAEGSALATAILITLRDKGAVVLATTHHGNLKIIANEMESFQNAAMEFDNENLVPTYKFKQGLPGSSYAFEVAERIGLEKTFLDLAKKYLDPDKTKVEEFLIQLERKSKKLQDNLEKMELENIRLKGLTKLYQEKNSALEKQKKDILKKAKDEAENYIKDINKEFEATIKRIKESNASREVIKQEKQKIQQVKTAAKEIFKEEELVDVDVRELKEGEYASIKNTSTIGVITKINKNKNSAVLFSGNIKMSVKLSELIPSKKKRESEVPTQSKLNYITTLKSLKLDIRGHKPEEVDYELIKFLDDAYSSNVSRVEILHGKGTGVLKKTVHEILKNQNYVSSFYFANIEMGGEGITIVELK